MGEQYIVLSELTIPYLEQWCNEITIKTVTALNFNLQAENCWCLHSIQNLQVLLYMYNVLSNLSQILLYNVLSIPASRQYTGESTEDSSFATTVPGG